MTVTKAKLILLGDSGVGKTSIILRQDGRPFEDEYTTTLGATFLVSTVQIQNDLVQLQIWDTAGQERFRSMVPMYLRNAKAAFIVYDVTDRASFAHVEDWIADVDRWTSDPLEIVIIGNKSDLESFRMVSIEEGKELATRHNMRFFETSALQNKGIEGVFTFAAEQVLLKKERSERSSSTNSQLQTVRVNRRSTPKREKKCCK